MKNMSMIIVHVYTAMSVIKITDAISMLLIIIVIEGAKERQHVLQICYRGLHEQNFMSSSSPSR